MVSSRYVPSMDQATNPNPPGAQLMTAGAVISTVVSIPTVSTRSIHFLSLTNSSLGFAQFLAL
jgi:hypothetical protein